MTESTINRESRISSVTIRSTTRIRTNNSAVEARGRHREEICANLWTTATIRERKWHSTHLVFSLVTGVDKRVTTQVHADFKMLSVFTVQNKVILNERAGPPAYVIRLARGTFSFWEAWMRSQITKSAVLYIWTQIVYIYIYIYI